MAADPSRSIARLALSVLCHVGDDDSVLDALRNLPIKMAAKALFRLGRSRRIVVDRFVDERAAAGDVAAWPLVPLASLGVLDRHFALAAERGGDLFWRRLAALHPARASAEILARLHAASNVDGLLFSHARTTIAVLLDRDPDLALEVLAALRKHVPHSMISLHTLVDRRTIAVADLVINSDEPAWASFSGIVHRLDVPRIVGLVRRGASHIGDPGSWFSRLLAADRIAIFRELSPAWNAPDGVIAASILRRLPTQIRQEEARRMLGLPALATRPLQRLPFDALLPWDEARAEVAPWLSHPEAEHRAAALVALCEAVRFDRMWTADLLELLIARKHEQDPVRLVFLNALSALPPGRWEVGHLTGLARVIRASLEAGDLSTGSVIALGRLVFSLLPFHPTWAAGSLAELTRERGYPGWSSRELTAEDVRRISPALTPIAESWLNREDEGRVVALAATIGRRLPDWPDLVGFLEKLIRTGRDHTAASAMALVAQHVPADRERIITEALAKDESWVLQRSVMDFLHARRQDLITPFLGQRPYSGRFSTGKVRHVLPLGSGFARWTDAQQEVFAGSLAELATPPARKKDAEVMWDVLSAVRRLPALPAVGPDRLVKLASDPRPAVRETAVRALGRLDARQGIPELLEALGDDRARWAVYARRQALNDLPPGRVIEVMRGVPFAKVTMAKEALRLAGEFGGSEAIGWFDELHRRDLHRDVRGALLRALWDHLDRPEAWAILDESAASPDPGVVIGLARIQVDRASDAVRDRVAGLFGRLLGHPEPTVRVGVLGRLATQPVPDPKRGLIAVMLAKLATAIPDERSATLSTALAGASDADAPAFAAAFKRILPRRRELASSVAGYADATRGFGSRLLEIRSAVLTAVEVDPSLTHLQIRLAGARFASEAFAHWVLGLVGTDRWHVQSQILALDALSKSGRPANDLERAEAVWASSPDPAARWLALRTLSRIAVTQGWSEARTERLLRYREDSSPLVADEAALTFPPEPEHPAREAK